LDEQIHNHALQRVIDLGAVASIDIPACQLTVTAAYRSTATDT